MRFLINYESDDQPVMLRLVHCPQTDNISLEAMFKDNQDSCSTLLRITPNGTIIFEKFVSTKLGFVLDECGVVKHTTQR